MPPDAANPLSGLFPMAMIAIIFYLIVFRPHRQQQKKTKELIAGLKKNDQVVTAGGIHGTVTLVKEKTVVLRVDDNTRIEFEKDSVTTLTKPGTGKESPEPAKV